MSVVKLSVAYSSKKQEIGSRRIARNALSSLDHTYGITSDPLTQFACVFAALIHDVIIRVPNTQLVKGERHIATAYQGKSVAEQNSWTWPGTCSWTNSSVISATPCAPRTRRCVGSASLLSTPVMATDIMDKDLKALRDGARPSRNSNSSEPA
jgi:hypothetical protein